MQFPRLIPRAWLCFVGVLLAGGSLAVHATTEICNVPLQPYVGMKPPTACGDPAGCALACDRDRDPQACRWVLAALIGSRLPVLDSAERTRLEGIIREGDPSRLDAPPDTDREEPSDASGEELETCDAVHPWNCDPYGVSARCDPTSPCPELEDTRRVLTESCFAGTLPACELAVNAGELLRDNGATVKAITSHFSQACGREDLAACHDLAFLLENVMDDEVPAELVIRTDRAARAADSRRETACRGGDWLACVDWRDGMEQAHDESPEAFQARRAAAARVTRSFVRPLMSDYLALRCEEDNHPSCAALVRVALADAEEDGDEGGLESLISGFERRCWAGNNEDFCRLAGVAVLRRSGDGGLHRARPLLIRSCASGGCEALVNHLRDQGSPADSGWRAREIAEVSRQGCAAGVAALCKTPTVAPAPPSGIQYEIMFSSCDDEGF